MTGITGLSALQLRTLLHAGELSAGEVTAAFVAEIARLNPQLGSFSRITADTARAEASALDAARKASRAHGAGAQPLPPLWGLPVGHKDLVDVAGVPTTYGSRAFDGAPAAHDDTLVATLRAAGTVSLGKTQVPEFGLAGYSENLVAAPARSPLAPECTAGGSSGGAAAAVAAGMLPFAPGSDAGGSIRIPAACCAVVGLKPGRGTLPADRQAMRHSGAPPETELTVQGPLARNAVDAALLYDAMRKDASESTLRLVRSARPRRLRIGVTTASPFDADMEITPDTGVLDALAHAAELLRDLGHTVEDASITYLPGYYQSFSDTWQSRFGRTVFTPQQIAQFTPYTRHCYERGRGLSPRAAAAAGAKLTAIAKHARAQWEAYDLMLTPVLTARPPRIGYFEQQDPETNFRLQCRWLPYTSIVNVTGLPAISVPLPGVIDSLHSAQLIGKSRYEPVLLQVAHSLEQL